MNLERFRLAAGVEFLSVHTKGASEALTEVISGRADCYFALDFPRRRRCATRQGGGAGERRAEAQQSDARGADDP